MIILFYDMNVKSVISLNKKFSAMFSINVLRDVLRGNNLTLLLILYTLWTFSVFYGCLSYLYPYFPCFPTFSNASSYYGWLLNIALFSMQTASFELHRTRNSELAWRTQEELSIKNQLREGFLINCHMMPSIFLICHMHHDNWLYSLQKSAEKLTNSEVIEAEVKSRRQVD